MSLLKHILSKEHSALFIIIFIFTLYYAFLFDPKPFPGGDNAHYISLAYGLTRVGRFCQFHSPGCNLQKLRPFGYPLLLAPLTFFKSIIPMKIENYFFAVFTLSLLFLIFRETRLKYIVPGILCVYLPFIQYSYWVLSEIPFLFFVLLTVYSIKKGKFLSASLSTIYAFFIRSAGLTLIFALLIHLLFRKKFKYLLILLILSSFTIGLWELRNSRIESQQRTYLEQFLSKNPYSAKEETQRITLKDLIHRIKKNFVFYSHFRVFDCKVLSGILLLLFLIGLTWGIIHKEFISIYTFLYLCLILVWPEVWKNVRFLIPVVPFIISSVFQGLVLIQKWFKTKLNLTLIVFAFTFTFFSTKDVKKFPEYFKVKIEYSRGNILYGYPLFIRELFSAALWAKENIPEDNIIIVRKPALFWLYSRRKCIIYPFTTEADTIIAFIKRYRVKYVVMDNMFSSTRCYLKPAIKRFNAKKKVIYESEYVKILQIYLKND